MSPQPVTFSDHEHEIQLKALKKLSRGHWVEIISSHTDSKVKFLLFSVIKHKKMFWGTVWHNLKLNLLFLNQEKMTSRTSRTKNTVSYSTHCITFTPKSLQNPPLSLGHKTWIVKNNTVAASVIPFIRALIHSANCSLDKHLTNHHTMKPASLN